MFSERRRPYLEGLRRAPSLCRILPMPPPVHQYDTQLCRSMRRWPRGVSTLRIVSIRSQSPPVSSPLGSGRRGGL